MGMSEVFIFFFLRTQSSYLPKFSFSNSRGSSECPRLGGPPEALQVEYL